MKASLSSIIDVHLDRIRDFYDSAANKPSVFGSSYRRLLAKYYRYIIASDASVLEIGCGSGELLALLPNRDVAGIDLSAKQIESAKIRLPHGKFVVCSAESLRSAGILDRHFDYIVLSDLVNLLSDVQQILENLMQFARPGTCLVLNFYNTVWYPILQAAAALSLKSSQPTANWLSAPDMRNLLDLSGWEVIHQECRVLVPVPIPLIAAFFNRFVAPLFSPLGLVIFQTCRKKVRTHSPQKKVSVIVPARNESGNIEAVVQRMPIMGSGTEIIFVEGGSKDDTFARIQHVAASAGRPVSIRVLRQTGKGKGNAVREGFAAAEGEILLILDADLTTPPEDLPKFYNALADGHTDFANGVRLVYPMEEKAMRFLNMCANKFFSIAFTWILGQPIKDTLCGTKAISRANYLRIAANRSFFGDFDPFGDFDLLFGAAKLNLKITDLPVRYRERTYGETNISRWSHGWLLLKMVRLALMRIKFI
jgi:ubiquinone/menaquinone biosynthesis C-methylase UbiE